MSLTILILSVLIYTKFILSVMSVPDGVLHRSKRQLLWPNSTLLQFNAGVGSPTANKMININWAFQANFQLPWNRTQIPTDIFGANSGYVGFARKKREADSKDEETERDGGYENDAKLYHFYKYVEDILNGFGHNGSSCVLQTLCQLGAEPLHSDDDEDLLHELGSFVLNPTNDAVADMTERDDQYPYILAFNLGRDGGDCSLYKDCKVALTDMFSKLHDHDSVL